MRTVFYIAFCWCAVSMVQAQGYVRGISDWQPISILGNSKPSPKVHGAIQPAIRQYVVISDSSGAYAKTDFFRVHPYPDLALHYDNDYFFYRAAAGFSAEALLNDKWYARVSAASGWSTREGINQTHPAFMPHNNHNAFWYNDVRARIAYTPNKMLHVAAGIDNQFFGEGTRSLIQSDQVAPNPFAMMRVTAWKLEYGLLYQFFHEHEPTNRMWKFGTTHYLSFNATRRWNISLFETVLFQPTDSSYNRGFELEYLNPIVFFRPQEYSLGSSDNVLLALHTSYRFSPMLNVYGQLSLDEFVLSEIRARSRWWANKYGAQLGFKGHIDREHVYRIEGNVVRPYTYAYSNAGQNYGQLGRPTGHPLGSNFAELLVEINALKTKWQNWSWKSYGVFQLQGFDEGSVNWGGNVYENYLNHPMEYGHRIGQGLTVRTIRLGCEFSYKIPSMNLRAYIDPQLVYRWGDVSSRFIPAISAGLRSELFQTRRRF